MEEIPPEIQKGVRAALGERFRHGLVKIVQVETKGEKTDDKILALKSCRAFILSSKNPPKLEHEFNYLELELIESTKPKQVKLKLQERRDAFLVTAPSPEEVTSIIEFIAESLKRVFPHTSLESFFDVKLEPADRLQRLQTHLDCFSLPDLGPCGGFSQMYQFMCDLHNQSYMEEVAWDIDTIYLSQDSKELSLNDFDHLEAKDLIPILSALMYNSWFKKLTAKDIKLAVEATKEVINVIKKSSFLEQLVLNNAGFKSDFGRDVTVALQSNTSSALVLLDLSNNHLDDRGVKFLCPALAKLQNGLVELSLANTGVTAEGVSALGKALSENNFFPTSLMRLNLSGNPLKDGNIENLLNFLAQPNHVTHLDLSDCGIALDTIFSALFRGCVNLTHVNFSGNVYTHKKVRDATVPKAVKQFFATTTKLQNFNVAYCKLLPEAIKELLLGIGSNRNLESVELNLSSNDLRNEGAKVIASCIANVPNITSLNLSNNDLCLDMANLLVWIGQNKVLSHLDLSENLTNIRQKNLSTVLDAIVDLIQDEESPIKSLSLARNKLKFETIPIINALGSNTTLTSIDISGNLMGDIGARMLAKALQINCKLEKIVLDNNNISHKGFQDIAEALERNYSLKSIPPPMSDLSVCLKSGGGAEKAEAAFQQIQALLQRNHSPHKFADAQAFRLQQGFLYTTSHQLVDKLVVQIQDACKELQDCEEEDVQENIATATDFIKDADNSKQLLETLHEESRKNESEDVTQQLKEMATQIQMSAEEKLKKTAEGMIEGTKEKCAHVMENEELKENVVAVCEKRSKIPDKFVLSLIEQLNAQLSNQMSEANLAMAAHISDTIIDEIIAMLTNSHQKLGTHLSKYRNRTLSLSLPMVNGPTSSDTTDHGGTPAETPEKTPHFNKKEGDGAPSKTDLRDKRKSVKVRPKSTVIRAQDITPLPAVEEPGPSKPEPPAKSSPIPEKRTVPSKPAPAATANISLGDFDAVSSSSQRPLRDARQDRPRRPRNVRPTRAVAVAQSETNPGHSKDDNDGDVKDVGKGVEEFFQASVEPAFAVTPGKGGKEQSAGKEPKKEKKEKEVKERKDKKDKKDKKEEKKPKEEPKKEKKKGMFGGLFSKKRGSQPHITPEKEVSSGRRASEPANKVKEVEKPSPQSGRKLSGVKEEEVQGGSQTPEYRSSEDDLSSRDEIDGKIEEKEEAEEKKDEEPVEEKKALPVKKALKPGAGGAPFSPNVLADLKAQQARRKSKEILEPVQSNGTTDTPQKEDKPLPPVKPAAESGDKEESEKEKEETSPAEVTPPAKEEETPEKSSTPEENGEVPEKTPSPKKTSTSGQFVLPPSPAKRISNPQNSFKSTTESDSAEADVNSKQETPHGEPDKQEPPKGDSPSDPPTSPELPREQTPPSAAEDDDTPAEEEEDHAVPGASSPKPSPSNHAASLPAISLTINTEQSGEVEKTSPVSPRQQSPLKSPTSPSTSPSHDSQPLPQPSSNAKLVNPLFIPKKGSSFQEKPSKDEVVLQKKSASIGARPISKGDQGGKSDSEKGVPEKKATKQADTDKQNGGTEKNVEKEVVEKEDATKKTEIQENKATQEDEIAKEKPTAQADRSSKEISVEPEEQPKRSGSVSDRMKNFEKPEDSPKPMTLAEKRKSFERKDPPVAAPRPVSVAPKPAPRPKPTVAKRPLSGDKTAPPVKSPPGSVSKKPPPPVAVKRPVVKP